MRQMLGLNTPVAAADGGHEIVCHVAAKDLILAARTILTRYEWQVHGDLSGDAQALFRALSNYARATANVASDQEVAGGELRGRSDDYRAREGSPVMRLG